MRDRAGALAFGSAVLLAFIPRLAAAVTLEVGTVAASPGQRALVSVTLRSPDTAVAGTQNDLSFDPRIPVAVRQTDAGPRPDCTGNRPLLSRAGSFAFHPSGCTPGTDCVVRALVLTFSVDPIPDGTVLYTCNVDIDPAISDGTYPVRCSNAGASSPSGLPLAANCSDGAVQVSADLPTATASATRPPTVMPTPTATGTPCDPACPALEVGTAQGRPGQRVSLPVRIVTGGAAINGLQADLGFDAATVIAPDAHGQPDCEANTSTGPLFIATFHFQPPTCSPPNCTGLRAIVSFADDVVIPNQSQVFSCTIAIADDAPIGSYEIPIAAVGGSTASGTHVTMSGRAGAVVVGESGGGGGCQIAIPRDQLHVLIAACIVACLVLWRRRAPAPRLRRRSEE